MKVKEMDKIVDKIKLLGRDKKNKKDLVAFVDQLDWEKIEELVTTKLITTAGPDVLDTLFIAMSNSPQKIAFKTKTIRALLKSLRSPDIPGVAVQMLSTVILLEIPKLPGDGLASIADDCVESLRQNNDPHTSWKDILPECLRHLSEHWGNISLHGSDVKGPELATRCIGALCLVPWQPTILTQLATMFREIKLPKEDHLQIINKLCHDLDKLSPDSLPSLLHQLLRLCKEHNSPIVYIRISDYFSTRLYPELLQKDENQESESPIVDLDMIEPAGDETRRAHATCVLFAGCDAYIHKHLLNMLKLTARRPATLLSSPSLIQLLLASEQQKEICIQIIKSSLMFNCLEQSKRRDFTWCSDILPGPVDAENLFKTLVESSRKHCLITSSGLLSLSLSLLSVAPPFATPAMAASLSRVARLILARILPGALREAIKLIPIASLPDTLEVLQRTCGPALSQCALELQHVLEACVVSGADARAARRIVHMLAPFNRDNAIMLCRKGQFSRDPGVGRVAVVGFLSLLGALRYRDTASQDSSAHSVLTQISINVHSCQEGTRSKVNNAAVCSEIVSLLRKSFYQSWEVREQLYLGLPQAMLKKPDLLETMLALLHNHLVSKYLNSGEESSSPIMFDACLVVRKDGVVLQEPIGVMIFAVHKMIQRIGESEDGIENGSYAAKFDNLLTSVSAKMANCTPLTFQLDENVSLNELSPEATSTCIILRQILQTCDALMAHCVSNAGGTLIRADVKSILGLHKTYCLIVDFIKNCRSKKQPEKSGKRTKKGASTQDPEHVTKETKGKRGPMKLSDMTRERGTGFRGAETVWDMETLHSMLQLLHYDSQKWCSKEESNLIRTNRLLHRYVVRSGIGVLKFHSTENFRNLSSDALIKPATILYERCIKRLDDFAAFDQETALLVVELFQEMIIAAAASVNDEELLGFLSELDENGTGDLSARLFSIAEIVGDQILKTAEESNSTEDPAASKIPPALLKLLTLLISKTTNTKYCNKWTIWLTELCSDSEKSKWVGSSAVSALLDVSARSDSPWTFLETLLNALTEIMGTSDEDSQQSTREEYTGQMCSISSALNSALLTLIQHLNRRLAAAELVAGRIRAELVGLPYRQSNQQQIARAALKNRERALNTELLYIVAGVRKLALLPAPPGPCCAALLKLLSRLHGLLATVTVHFMARGAPPLLAARFDRVIKLGGRQLTKSVNVIIQHCESVLDSGASKGRINQDMKLIPKLVFEVEQFGKRVIQLSKKTKLDLATHLSKLNARDFRIKASAVRDALQAHGTAGDPTPDDDDEQDGDLETSLVEEIDAAIEGADIQHSDSDDGGTSNRRSECCDNTTDAESDDQDSKPPNKKKRTCSPSLL